jgi:NAD(P)-dependent dehydrogenase (short-subunit alcohol dehydrogenase family)
MVTGGGSQIGLGKAIALTLAREGCDIVITDIDREGSEKTTAEIRALGQKAIAYQADITSSAEMNNVVKAVLNEFGLIDILVNNAGASKIPQSFHSQSEDDVDFILDVILRGPMKCTKAVINHMISRKTGKIINITSVTGIYPGKDLCIYSAAKAGLIAFTKALAIEVAPYGINVNSVAPGLVKTNFGGGPPSEMTEAVEKETPTGRLAVPQDIANAVLFFASDISNDIVGETVMVSGGHR